MGIVYDGENTYTDASQFDKVKVVPPGKVLYKESNPTRSVYWQNQRTTKNGIAIDTETGWHLVDIEEYLQNFSGALDEETLNKISKIYGLDVSQYLQEQKEAVAQQPEEEQVPEEVELPPDIIEKITEEKPEEQEKEQVEEVPEDFVEEEIPEEILEVIRETSETFIRELDERESVVERS